MNIFIIIFWVLIGVACAYIAKERGRDPLIWFFIGTLFGVFGLLLLLILPTAVPEMKAKEEDQAIPVVVTALDFKDKEWFYLDSDRKQIGPVPYATLAEEWKKGTISHETLVWSEGMDKWHTIDEQPDLKLDIEEKR